MALESRRFTWNEAVDHGADMFAAKVGDEPAAEPTTLDVAAAAMRRESIFGSALYYGVPRLGLFEDREEGYQPMAGATDEEWADYEVLRRARSPQHKAAIQASLDKERRDKEVLLSSGLEGMAWTLAAGATDPMLVPLYAIPIARAATVPGAAMKAGVITAGQAAIGEAGLRGLQEERDWTETLLAVGGAAIMGGALGAAGKALSGPADLRIRTDGEADIKNAAGNAIETLGDDGEAISTVGAAAKPQDIGQFQNPTKWNKLNPMLRGVTNESGTARDIMHRTANHNLYLAENQVGKGVDPGTIQTQLVRLRNGLAFEFGHASHQAYKKYMQASTLTGARLRGGVGKQLSYPAFLRRAGRAAFNNDVDLVAPANRIPEVEETSKAFRKIIKALGDEQVKLGILKPEDLVTEFAPSYRPRQYIWRAIEADPRQFIMDLAEGFYRMAEEEGLIRGLDAAGIKALKNESIDAARQVKNNMAGTMEGALPKDLDLLAGVTGKFAKARTLPLPDEFLSDRGWLQDNLDEILHDYLQTMVPEISMRRVFPDDPTWAEAKKDIRAEYTRAVSHEPNKKKAAALDRQSDKSVRDVNTLYEAVHGRLGMPLGKPAGWTKFARITRGLTFVTQLGQMTIAAVNDVAKVVMEHGAVSAFRGTKMALRSFSDELVKMRKMDLRRMGIGTDLLLSSRVYAMGEVQGRTMERYTGMFAKATLVNHWTSSMKTITAFAAQDEVGRLLPKALDGNDKAIEKLARWGLNKDMQRRVWAQYQKGEKYKGMWFPDTGAWDDSLAREVFENAQIRDVETTIVTPGLADRPWSMVSNEWGKSIGQFKSFFLASHNQTFIPLLQKMGRNDAQAYQALAVGLVLGAGTTATRMLLAGRQDEMDNWTTNQWALEAVDRSGLAAVPMELFNMSNKFAQGQLAQSMGIPQASRYQYRNKFGTLMGPGFGYVEDAYGLIQNSMDGDLTETDARRIRKLAPYQNLFYTRWLFNWIEQQMAEEFE